jgi:hypothetical protein
MKEPVLVTISLWATLLAGALIQVPSASQP